MDKIPIEWLREYQKRYDEIAAVKESIMVDKGSLMSMAIDIIIDDFEAEMEEEKNG